LAWFRSAVTTENSYSKLEKPCEKALEIKRWGWREGGNIEDD
jgi:hypothetical protein